MLAAALRPSPHRPTSIGTARRETQHTDLQPSTHSADRKTPDTPRTSSPPGARHHHQEPEPPSTNSDEGDHTDSNTLDTTPDSERTSSHRLPLGHLSGIQRSKYRREPLARRRIHIPYCRRTYPKLRSKLITRPFGCNPIPKAIASSNHLPLPIRQHRFHALPYRPFKLSLASRHHLQRHPKQAHKITLILLLILKEQPLKTLHPLTPPPLNHLKHPLSLPPQPRRQFQVRRLTIQRGTQLLPNLTKTGQCLSPPLRPPNHPVHLSQCVQHCPPHMNTNQHTQRIHFAR